MNKNGTIQNEIELGICSINFSDEKPLFWPTLMAKDLSWLERDHPQ
jgi:hypothetical protein